MAETQGASAQPPMSDMPTDERAPAESDAQRYSIAAPYAFITALPNVKSKAMFCCRSGG
ncbi:MAG: hypothetical protein AAF668_01765 [Pseudomonadota bacterium]